MNVSQTKAEGLVREYAIVITADEIDKEVAVKLSELAKTVKMPGFRPGKVPMSVVKSRFGPQVQGDAIKTALDEGARQAIEGNDLRLASQPSVDIKEYEEGKDLTASLTCEVMPDITVPDLAKLKIEKPTLEAGDAEVDEALSNIAEGNRPSVEVKKSRAAKNGDILVIDFIGRIDGEAFEGGAADGHALELGSNSFIPGFEDGLIGAKVGQTLDVNVSFPEDYQAAHLAGKPAVFEVTVQEMREQAEARIDDDLGVRLGFENLQGLKDAVREQINAQHATALRQALKKNVLDALADGPDFDVPPSLYKQEYESVARAMNPTAHDHNHDHDHDHDHDHHHPAADEGMDDAAKEEAASVAQRRVRLGLLLTEIGRTNNIDVSEEDTRQAVMDEARRYPGQEQMVFEYFQKNPEAMQQLAGPIFEDKTIDFIMEMAKVTEVKTSVEALYAEPEAAAPAKKTAKKAAKKASAKKAPKEAAAKKAPAKKAAAKKAAKKASK